MTNEFRCLLGGAAVVLATLLPTPVLAAAGKGEDAQARLKAVIAGDHRQEKNRAKYMAMGESDRMTLKFVKPVE